MFKIHFQIQTQVQTQIQLQTQITNTNSNSNSGSISTSTSTSTTFSFSTSKKISTASEKIKELGMVNCTPDFGDQPLVINAYTELMADVFRMENGVGVRSAVGMILPGGIAVEIEAIFELHK